MKKFFTLSTIALALSLSASAKYQLSLDELPNGWGSTYDAATKTITYEEGAWGGCGWNMAPDNVPFNFIDEDIQYCIVKLKSSDVKLNIVAEYTDGTIVTTDDGPALNKVGSSNKTYDAGETLLVLQLNDTFDQLIQIFIQNLSWSSTAVGENPGGTAVLEDAFLCSEDEYQAILNEQPVVAEEAIWTGNTKFDSWTGFSIGASRFAKASVGDKLVFTLTELFDVPAQNWSYGAQVLVKKSSWGDFDPGFVSEHIAITEAVPYELEMTLREDVLAEAQANGLVIQGMGFTVTEVKIKYEGAPAEVQKIDLSLKDLGSGWGDSTYDSSSKTITIGTDWSGKGWWLDDVDYSAFSYVVVEFAEATAANGKVVVESAEGSNGDDGLFDVSCLVKVVPLAPGADHTKQVYIQGPAGTQYKLAAAYVATADYISTNGIVDKYADTEGIHDMKAESTVKDGAIYNLAGQRVNATFKGVVIQNGHKFIQK